MTHNGGISIPITYRGVTYVNARALCDAFDVSVATFRDRQFRYGWSVKKALGHETHIRGRWRPITFQGKTYVNITALCEAFNINHNTYRRRIRSGWSTAQALGTKKRKYEPSVECNGIVYRILNRVTGEVYVGLTTQPLKDRMRSHKNGSHCLRLWQDMRKYGFKNFSYKVIYRTTDRKLLVEKEKHFIREYDSIAKGYNTLKGSSGNGWTGGTRLKFKGKQYRSIKEFANAFHLSYGLVKYRLKAGYSLASIVKLSPIFSL